MATVPNWSPFGVALNITATAGKVTRISATQYKVVINVSWQTRYSGAKTNYGMSASSGNANTIISAFGTSRSSGSGSFTGTYSIDNGGGSASKTITVTFKNYEENWKGEVTSSATEAIDLTVSVPAVNYTIAYNANGGTGAPNSQTKQHGESIKISTAIPTRAGYTFNNWALSKTDADNGTWYYKPGATCGANDNLTLYAVWISGTYAITYNANGGTGAPSKQTKDQGETIQISSATPTRSGYIFKGWSSSANSSTVVYNPGDNYTANANITLYAVWVAAETPEITNLYAERCNSLSTVTDEGTLALISFDWSCAAAVSSIVIRWKKLGTANWLGSTTVTASGTSGKVSDKRIGITTGTFELETSYTIQVEVTDANGGFSSATRTLGESAYPMEFIEDNKGVHFGKAVQGHAVGLADLVILADGSEFNDLTKPGGWSVPSNASAATMGNIPIQQAGRVFVATSNGYDDPNSEFKYYIQTYIPYLVTYPIFERHVRKTSATTWIYSPWVVIKRNRASAITAWASANITKAATGETQIPLTECTAVGDGLTIENNAIVIGQYINAVEVSAAGMIKNESAVSNAAKNLMIKKNGTEVAVSMNSSWSANKANYELNITPKLVTVTEGDIITLHWYASANDLLSSANARTYITVKEF